MSEQWMRSINYSRQSELVLVTDEMKLQWRRLRSNGKRPQEIATKYGVDINRVVSYLNDRKNVKKEDEPIGESVLLSIHPEYARKIFSGEKLYEYRRVLIKPWIKTVYVYLTKNRGVDKHKDFGFKQSDRGNVIGSFSVDGLLKETPNDLWLITKEHSGISKEYFDQYFDGKDMACAIKAKSAKLFDDPKPLSEFGLKKPPQSFVYLRDLV